MQDNPSFLYNIPISEAGENCSPIFRNAAYPEKLLTNLIEPSNSIYQVLQRVAQKNPQYGAIGEKKVSPSGEKHYEWISYSEMIKKVDQTAKFLNTFDYGENRFIAWFSELSISQFILDFAMMRACCVSLPLYPKLTLPHLRNVFNLTQPRVVAGASELLLQKIESYPDLFESVEVFIILDFPSENLQEEVKKLGAQFFIVEDQIQKEYAEDVAGKLPQIDDVFTITFTSGTTGVPKGVQISHRNMISGIQGLLLHFNFSSKNPSTILCESPGYIAVRVFTLMTFFEGFSHAISRPENIQQDLQLAKPTFFFALAYLLKNIYHWMQNQALSIISEDQYRSLLDKRISALGGPCPAEEEAPKVLFNKLGNLTGGRLQVLASTAQVGAPHIFKTLKAILQTDAIDIYGQSQTSAGCILTVRGVHSSGHVGRIGASEEFKLVDVPELGFTHKDKPYPRGHLFLRGANVTCGYYKLPERNHEVRDEDGWRRTGDAVMLVEGNALKILDRLDALFNLKNRQIIAPQQIQAVLQQCPLVLQALVYGDNTREYLVAIIVPREDAVHQEAKRLNLSKDMTYDQLCQEKAINQEISKQLEEVCSRSGIDEGKRVKKFVISTPIWTAEDLLTETRKLRRKAAYKHFNAQIEALYEEL